MENEPFVQILLATYNGEKYLTEQLDSLITQTYTNWECLISDDCSTDKTLEIIEKYCHTDSRFKLVSKGIKHSSLNENFLDLMQHSTAEYVLFCDQDDFWLDNKVETLVGRMVVVDNANENVPICVFSDSIIVDSKLSVLVESFQSTLKNDARHVDVIDVLGSNVVQGCSSIINRKLVDVVVSEGNFDYFNVYDWLIGAIASSNGVLVYIPDRLLLYRQHEFQVCGTKKESVFHYIFRLFQNALSDREQAKVTIKLDASVIGRAKRILSHFPPKDIYLKKELEYLDTFSSVSCSQRIKILNHFKWFKADANQRIALLIACLKDMDWITHY